MNFYRSTPWISLSHLPMVVIAVLGCGTMGLKIAGNFAYCGHCVKLFDCDLKQLETAYQRITQDRDRLFADGLLERPILSGQIVLLNRLDQAVKDVQFIFECVFENLELKQDLVQNVAQHAPAEAIICSNTMQLDLEKISEKLPHKQNFVGLRFLFPVYYIREVELNLTKWTSTQTIDALRKLLEPMDKVLFFRSSSVPFILNQEQIENRRKIRFDTLRNKRFTEMRQNSVLPELTTPVDCEQDSIGSQSPSDCSATADGNLNCSICMDRNRDALIRSCNHFVACFQCAQHLFQEKGSCPVCRKPIDEVIRIYT